MNLTHDDAHHYRGLWDEGGVCRVRIFQAPDATPVIVCTELPENTNTSVTNMMEYLAAELIAKHFPDRFDYPEPAIVVEHYPPPAPGADGPRRRHACGDFDRVTFASWAPRRVYERGVERVKLGEPSWSPLSIEEVVALVGDASLVTDEPTEAG